MEYIHKDGYIMMIGETRGGSKFEVKISPESLEKAKSLNNKWHLLQNNTMDTPYVAATLYMGIIEGKPIYKTIYLHRYLVDAKENEYVDHVNHDTLDNRLDNLEIKTNGDNLINRKRLNRNNSTGYRNVSYSKSENKYIVQLQVNGKNTVLGKFDDVHEAGKFAEDMREIHYKSR